MCQLKANFAILYDRILFYRAYVSVNTAQVILNDIDEVNFEDAHIFFQLTLVLLLINVNLN